MFLLELAVSSSPELVKMGRQIARPHLTTEKCPCSIFASFSGWKFLIRHTSLSPLMQLSDLNAKQWRLGEIFTIMGLLSCIFSLDKFLFLQEKRKSQVMKSF